MNRREWKNIHITQVYVEQCKRRLLKQRDELFCVLFALDLDIICWTVHNAQSKDT